MRTIDTEAIEDDTALIFTDFSATDDLRAAQTDNSSEDAHMTIAIYVVLHSSREVQVDTANGAQTKWINDCDVWYCVGPTISKGKKNDHVYHNACLDHLLEHYKSKFEECGKTLKTAMLWTDNCGGQYKCRQNFLKIALSPDDPRKVTISHTFAAKYGFKGPWDAAGKIIKQWRKSKELRMHKTGEKTRMATVYDVFTEFKRYLEERSANTAADSWKAIEEPAHSKHEKILQKTAFKVDERKVLYVTDNKADFERFNAKDPGFIVYSDRETVPTMDPIDGTLSLHSVKSVPGARNQENEGLRQLVIADFPCRCLPCQKKGPPEDKCKFTELRNERVEWVNTSGEGTRASHLLDTDEEEQKLLLRLQRFGLEKARVQDIREYLKTGKMSTSWNLERACTVR